MSYLINAKYDNPGYLRLAYNGVTIEVSTDNVTWGGIGVAVSLMESVA